MNQPTAGIPMGVLASQCPECSDGEGKVSAEFLRDASCLFGCGATVGEDGFCPKCRDHSRNEMPCETCGFTYADDWGQPPFTKEWTR